MPLAPSDTEPHLGLPTGPLRGFTSVGRCATLVRGNFLASSRLSHGMLFGEPGAFAKRFGSPAQGRCQALGGLPGMTRGALGPALAVGDLALVRGRPPATSRLLSDLSLFEPIEERSLSPRFPPVSGLCTLISQTLASIRDLFTLVGGPLSRIRDPLALIREPVTLIRG